MRACLITSLPLPPEEGVGHHVWNLARQLTEDGHRVGIITRGGPTPTQEVENEGITIWRAPFVPVYPAHVHVHGCFVNRLLRRIESQFDVINEHTPLPPVANTRLPVVTTVHSPMRSDTAATSGRSLHALATRLQTPISQRIETGLFRRSQKITAVAQWVAQALEAYAVAPGEVAITGNGVEARFFHSSATGKKEPFVLYVGRLQEGKGLVELVQAAAIVTSRHPNPDLRFVLVGKGPLLPTLQRMVREAGLQRQVLFLGHIDARRRDELIDLYRQATIFVLPSHHEGMPTVLLEAMASGLPVVTTAVGGSLEVVVDGENGRLIPPRRPTALAAALHQLLENPSMRRRLGQNAQNTAQESYSWPAIGEKYLSCYAQAMDIWA